MRLIDPIAITAATLLASKALEGFGGKAGESAWGGMTRLGTLVRRKAAGSPEARAALSRLERDPTNSAHIHTLAEAILELKAQDEDFERRLVAIVSEARKDPTLGPFVSRVEGLAGVGTIVNLGDVHVYLPTPPLVSASHRGIAPPAKHIAGSRTLGHREDKESSLTSSVEDDLRALQELAPLLDESVVLRFQERILFRRFPHLRS